MKRYYSKKNFSLNFTEDVRKYLIENNIEVDEVKTEVLINEVKNLLTKWKNFIDSGAWENSELASRNEENDNTIIESIDINDCELYYEKGYPDDDSVDYLLLFNWYNGLGFHDNVFSYVEEGNQIDYSSSPLFVDNHGAIRAFHINNSDESGIKLVDDILDKDIIFSSVMEAIKKFDAALSQGNFSKNKSYRSTKKQFSEKDNWEKQSALSTLIIPFVESMDNERTDELLDKLFESIPLGIDNSELYNTDILSKIDEVFSNVEMDSSHKNYLEDLKRLISNRELPSEYIRAEDDSMTRIMNREDFEKVKKFILDHGLDCYYMDSEFIDSYPTVVDNFESANESDIFDEEGKLKRDYESLLTPDEELGPEYKLVEDEKSTESYVKYKFHIDLDNGYRLNGINLAMGAVYFITDSNGNRVPEKSMYEGLSKAEINSIKSRIQDAVPYGSYEDSEYYDKVLNEYFSNRIH